jgi:hypothetical protein
MNVENPHVFIHIGVRSDKPKKHPDAVSRWVSQGAASRIEDEEFAGTTDDLDIRLSEQTGEEVARGTRLMD